MVSMVWRHTVSQMRVRKKGWELAMDTRDLVASITNKVGHLYTQKRLCIHNMYIYMHMYIYIYICYIYIYIIYTYYIYIFIYI
jgi:hypothetical protein